MKCDCIPEVKRADGSCVYTNCKGKDTVEKSTEVGKSASSGVLACPCGEEECTYEQGELYWHEALDRSHVACDHFYEYVQRHPAVQHDKELEELATKVTDAMQDFYQKVCSKSCEFEDR